MIQVQMMQVKVTQVKMIKIRMIKVTMTVKGHVVSSKPDLISIRVAKF
jgi:hypothetical protein